MKRLLAAGMAVALASAAQAVTVVPLTDASTVGGTLVDHLLQPSSGLTVQPGSVQYIGNTAVGQSGTYSGFDFAATGGRAALSIADGIVLSSGSAQVPDSNTAEGYTTITGTGGSEVISEITDRDSYDQNLLSFSFEAVAGSTSVSASFIFGTDEYPEFAESPFVDGFAFVVDGVNYATFPDGSPVSLLTYESNDNLLDNQEGLYGIEYDGLTQRLTITGLLDTTRSVHTLDIIVADTGDEEYDSAVYLSGLRAGTAGSGGVTPPPPIPEPETYALMLAGLAGVGFITRRRSRAKAAA